MRTISIRSMALVSIAVGIVVLAMKAAAWWVTGSAALYSDALESVVNVASSTLASAALFYAARPADANHPYGHEKAEFFAAVVVGVMIIVAALSIFQNAVMHWDAGAVLFAPWIGIGINLAATLLNAMWATLLAAAARRQRSPALRADARHLWSDVVTSSAVICGVVLILATRLPWLDSVISLLVGMHVLWAGWRVVRESVGGLMDEAPAGVMDRAREIVKEHAAGAIEAHDLRMRNNGRLTFLEFHLVVPGDMRVADAHAICDRVEGALRRDQPEMVITIHVEPEGKAKHSGVLVL